MATPILLNSDRLVPDELALQLGPFSSWLKDSSFLADYFIPEHLGGAADLYHEEGFLVLQNALVPVEKNLKTETRNLCRNEDGAIDGIPTAPQEMSDEVAMGCVLCVHFLHKLSSRSLSGIDFRLFKINNLQNLPCLVCC